MDTFPPSIVPPAADRSTVCEMVDETGQQASGIAALVWGVLLRTVPGEASRALPVRPGEADADEESSGPDGSVPSANAGASVTA